MKRFIALVALAQIGLFSPAWAQTYNASTHVDGSNIQLRTGITGSQYQPTTVDVCPVGVTLPDGSVTTATSVVGNLYSVGDVLHLVDGSSVRLTSVSNGQLTSGGFEFVVQNTDSSDPSITASLKYTNSFSATDTSNHIKNIISGDFSPGCLTITSATSATPSSSGSARDIAMTNLRALNAYVPGVVSDPNNTAAALSTVLNSSTSQYGSTFHLPDAARLPINTWNSDNSSIDISPSNYNNIRITTDGTPWRDMSSYAANAEWNGFDYYVALPQSVLLDTFSPSWGHVLARNYTDDRIYTPYGNSTDSALRSPGALETLDFRNHTNYTDCVWYKSWVASKAYTKGDTISYTDGTGKVYFYTAVTSGTSGSSITFTGTETSDIVDNSVTWTRISTSKTGTTDPRYPYFSWCGSDPLRGLSKNIFNINADLDTNISTTGITVKLNSAGKNGWGTFDIDQYNYMTQSGTNWSWTMVNQLTEVGSIGLGFTDPSNNNAWVSAGKMNYVQEWDLSGIGKESPDTYYDPTAGGRIAFWFSNWTNGGLTWSAAAAISQQQILLATNSSGSKYMYTARNDCTTGSSQPAWSFNETADIVDGTCHWVYSGAARYQISRFIGVDSTSRSTEVPISFGTMFASSATIYNSGIDFSTMKFASDVDDGVDALIRSPKNTYWDGSADGTRGGQNNNLFGYSGSGWVFRSKRPNGSFTQSFAVSTSSNSNTGYLGTTDALSTPAPTGSTISDATLLTSKFSIITESASDGLGVRINAAISSPGTVMEVKNATSMLINTFPVDTGWQFAGLNSAGDPLPILPGMTEKFIFNGNGSNVIEATGDIAFKVPSVSDSNLTAIKGIPQYESGSVILYNTTKNTLVTYDQANSVWTSLSDKPYDATITLTAIKAQVRTEGERVWCHDCRAPSQATGSGTGRWIYLDSTGTWRTDDGLEASS